LFLLPFAQQIQVRHQPIILPFQLF
jgi:hypothetical protein